MPRSSRISLPFGGAAQTIGSRHPTSIQQLLERSCEGGTIWHGGAVLFTISDHEPQVLQRETAQMREEGGQEAVAHAEPACQGGGILLDRGGGNQPPEAGIVRSVDGEVGEGAVEFAARDAAARHTVDVAPGVVGAVAIGGQGAAEIRQGEAGHGVAHPEFVHRGMEAGHRIGQLLQRGSLDEA